MNSTIRLSFAFLVVKCLVGALDFGPKNYFVLARFQINRFHKRAPTRLVRCRSISCLICCCE